MEKYFYLEDGKVYKIENNESEEIKIDSIISFIRVLDSIERGKSWKRKDIMSPVDVLAVEKNKKMNIEIDCICCVSEDKIIYSANFEGSSGVYFKNINDNTEELIIKLKGMRIIDMDYNKDEDKIICSFSRGDNYEVDLLMINNKKVDYKILTEGETIDRNPIFDKKDPNIIYYDCCGIGFYNDGRFAEMSKRYINKLILNKSDVIEVLETEKIDYYRPFLDNENNLYFIKRPKYNQNKNEVGIKDILLFPTKLLKVISNFQDFFKKRYTDETSLSGDENLDDEDVNDQVFGLISYKWKLIKKNLDTGEEIVIAKGVLDYTVNNKNEVIYSNGEYIFKINENHERVIICKAKLPTNILTSLV